MIGCNKIFVLPQVRGRCPPADALAEFSPGALATEMHEPGAGESARDPVGVPGLAETMQIVLGHGLRAS